LTHQATKMRPGGLEKKFSQEAAIKKQQADGVIFGQNHSRKKDRGALEVRGRWRGADADIDRRGRN